jgi:amidase
VGRSNVVGIKPTVGLTSRYLVIPVSEHQDTVGPIARTVKDAAIVLQVITGVDSFDIYTNENPIQGSTADYLSTCTAEALKGARLGVPDNVIALYREEGNQYQIDIFNAALEEMRSAGATIVRNTDFPAAAEYLESLGPTKLGGSSTARADFIVNIASYFKELSHNPESITSLEDLRAFTRADPREQYPDRDTAEWDRILAQGWDNTTPRFETEYKRVLRFGHEGGLLGTLKRYELDAVVLPTSFAPRWAAMVGTPIVTVPLGAYPEDTKVETSPRGDLVKMGPNFP